ncbi:hypothetical protein [Actinomadura violacea]|uniref:Uncharacterized protein n=1 Tax=Actinomadura violacea TaxID=2819934 RepID=A0ABS3S085_9ACTN|nr:hypothetical protein [Actinomadura violacea]MBO2461709.1 hypothetical protein [Actinomadura violacea]
MTDENEYDERTWERLTGIAVPADRLAEARKTVRRSRAKADAALHHRDAALAVLYFQHRNAGWGKSKCYRAALLDRFTFREVLERLPDTMKAPANTVDWGEVAARGEMDGLQTVYRRLVGKPEDEVAEFLHAAAREYVQETAVWEAARRVREQAEVEAKLSSINNPATRLAEAGEMARKAREKADALRHPRNAGLAVLHFQHKDKGWDIQANCYRAALLDRSSFQDALRPMPASMQVPPETVDWDDIIARGNMDELQTMYRELVAKPEPEVAQFVRDTAEEHRRLKAVWKAAGRVRDEVALDLMNGVHGPAWSNADVARTGRMKASYVTDLRQGKKQVA